MWPAGGQPTVQCCRQTTAMTDLATSTQLLQWGRFTPRQNAPQGQECRLWSVMSFYSLGWGRREAGGGGDRLPPSPPPGTGRARGQGHRVAQHPRSYSAGTRPNVRETNTEESRHTFLSGRALQGICSMP